MSEIELKEAIHIGHPFVDTFSSDLLQILASDDGTFPALLKTLSDSSEEVSDLSHVSCKM